MIESGTRPMMPHHVSNGAQIQTPRKQGGDFQMGDASAQSKKRSREDIVNEQITNLQFQGFAQSSSESQQIEALMN